MVPNPCYVCSSPANECHFGSKSQICRACSAFFRRYVLSPKSAIKCRKDKSCRIFFKDPKICRFCRMEKCVSAGMKTSAVQPPREKYSEDKADSDGGSCYSASPFTYEVQSCSREMPRLLRLSAHFKNLERVRKLEFQNQEAPKSRNMVELIEILRKDMRLVSNFVEGAYPEIGQVGKIEKKLLFLNFFIKYMLVEPPFLGLTTGRKEMVLPNGDHYEEDIGRFYTGHLDIENLSEQTADKFFTPYWNEYKRTVIDDVWFLKPDVFEFLAVSGLILWDTGLEGLSDQGIEVCRGMREKLVSEIHFYYKNIKKVEDPCLRLGQIMMLLASVQKSFGKYQEELEMCGFFEICKNLDTEACQIINESLEWITNTHVWFATLRRPNLITERMSAGNRDVRQCKACRMKKCLEVGMQVTHVQNKRDRHDNEKVQAKEETVPTDIVPFCYSKVSSLPTELQSSTNFEYQSMHLKALHQHFTEMLRLRKTTLPKRRIIRSLHHAEALTIFRKDVKLAANWIYQTFPEFSERLNAEQQQLLFRNFYLKWTVFEPAFLAVLLGKPDTYHLPTGDIVDEVSRYYTRHMSTPPRCSLDEVSRIFTPYWTDFHNTLVDPVISAKLTIHEFLLLTAICLFDVGLDGQSDECRDYCQEVRQQLFRELNVVCKSSASEDSCFRFAQNMLLLPSIQRGIDVFEEELQVGGLYRFLSTDTDDWYKMVDGPRFEKK
ncbi:unnamed protein product [Caenorhabditis sp. 36 PRJEB53466]|nr:unnamed protein product [Caenorhabditis sp. 36 PRJEB53466]